MSAEFAEALAKTEYEAAIRSLAQAVRDGDKVRVERDAALAQRDTKHKRALSLASATIIRVAAERDDALARLAAVRVACDGAESEGQHHITIEAIRAAMTAQPQTAQEACGTPPNSDEQPARAAQSEPTPTSQETGR